MNCLKQERLCPNQLSMKNMDDLEEIVLLKQNVRDKIASIKSSFTDKELMGFSSQVMFQLTQSDVFRQAKCILAYYGMKDEVDTKMFIEEYAEKKQFLLPVVVGNDLILKEYSPEKEMKLSSYGIWEPAGKEFPDYDQIDLVIVPGVAFDRKRNRLGRGKGFYDRLLSQIDAPKTGICFAFQLLDEIPASEQDQKMTMIVSQYGIID